MENKGNAMPRVRCVRCVRPGLTVGAAAVLLVGCSRTPQAVTVPPIDPDAAARSAILQYDANGDQQLSVDELESCPALRDARARYDRNADGQISESELAARFAMWTQGGIGVSTLACRIVWKGRPLGGAEVKFVPEPCLDDAIQPAIGITDASGTALLAIDNVHLPADLQNLRGVQQGLYRVVISHPEVELPTQYNSQTTLGKEVSFETGQNLMVLSLDE